MINGERQDVYGNPEDSFSLIADYWSVYLDSLGFIKTEEKSLSGSNVAIMMTLFKIAREANQHKRDNVRDASGYLGIYADMYDLDVNHCSDTTPIPDEAKEPICGRSCLSIEVPKYINQEWLGWWLSRPAGVDDASQPMG